MINCEFRPLVSYPLTRDNRMTIELPEERGVQQQQQQDAFVR
jgi:hypothetical protein